ncbi:MAG: hypothetical protein NC177_17520 [Ruminococcus flavefaciens]|nr:hypothetical protein [Ruminococcus flavefaciens]
MPDPIEDDAESVIIDDVSATDDIAEIEIIENQNDYKSQTYRTLVYLAKKVCHIYYPPYVTAAHLNYTTFSYGR